MSRSVADLGGLEEARRLYSEGEYQQAIASAEDILPHEENKRIRAEAHLLIGKCERSRGDLKAAISAANLSIQQYSKWKDPYLFRSACFQAFNSYLQETDGDLPENILKDREEADIIVDYACTPSKVEEEDETEKMKILFRKKEKRQIFLNSLCDAIRLVKSGGKIFIEKGEYRLRSSDGYFLHNKAVTILGASSSGTVLSYRCEPDPLTLPDSSNLETFLIASNSRTPIIIKRLCLRNENLADTVRTKLIGVAGGTLQIEDCLFDGLEGSGVDAVYANPMICGTFASSYPPPFIIIRFCIFVSCMGSGGITALNSAININNSLFTGVGGCSISAQSSSKVSVENCEFELTGLAGGGSSGGGGEEWSSAVRASSSDLTLTGSYVHCLEVGSSVLSSACQTVSTVAKISTNYFYRLGIGVNSTSTDLNCSRNMFFSCSPSKSAQGQKDREFHSAIRIGGGGKSSVTENVIRSCDLGICLTDMATPSIRDNIISSSLFCGLFLESGAKPIVVGNILQGTEANNQYTRGLGVLYLTGSAGTIGKNSFQDFCVSPLMVFTNCHPLIKDNRFDGVELVEAKQAEIEQEVIHKFTSQVEEESYFYLINSSERETALAQIIFKRQE